MATNHQVWGIWDFLGGGFGGGDEAKETIKKLRDLDINDAWRIVAAYKAGKNDEAKEKLAAHGILPHGEPWVKA